ncbi:GIY-YIG nuclease family protein [Haloarcula sp. Atlit-7R]|uniref:GIY-YIG nuclease family protein n=1 Tax=Haloarcula sp. Atlit-7R TaxID=2282125 RepID=UPI0011C3BCDE|nr:GIY-YIG nuclease family protein [Haloarcula sp. Atlit-7R]
MYDEVRKRIVERVPSETYRETDQILPFKHDTSRSTIASAPLPFATGEPRTYAVYVLECLQSGTGPATALSQGVSTASVSRYGDAGGSRRVIYVGMAKRVLDRIDQHLNKPGSEGAYFTALYPPVRILQVGWFNGKEQARDAERLTAGLLEERFPNDFIAYPG